MSKIKSLAASLLVTATFLPAMALAGDVVTVTDITGREVEVEVPVEKVILGEGRQIYFTAALDGEDPSNVSSAGETISRRRTTTGTISISRSIRKWPICPLSAA